MHFNPPPLCQQSPIGRYPPSPRRKIYPRIGIRFTCCKTLHALAHFVVRACQRCLHLIERQVALHWPFWSFSFYLPEAAHPLKHLFVYPTLPRLTGSAGEAPVPLLLVPASLLRLAEGFDFSPCELSPWRSSHQ